MAGALLTCSDTGGGGGHLQGPAGVRRDLHRAADASDVRPETGRCSGGGGGAAVASCSGAASSCQHAAEGALSCSACSNPAGPAGHGTEAGMSSSCRSTGPGVSGCSASTGCRATRQWKHRLGMPPHRRRCRPWRPCMALLLLPLLAAVLACGWGPVQLLQAALDVGPADDGDGSPTGAADGGRPAGDLQIEHPAVGGPSPSPSSDAARPRGVTGCGRSDGGCSSEARDAGDSGGGSGSSHAGVATLQDGTAATAAGGLLRNAAVAAVDGAGDSELISGAEEGAGAVHGQHGAGSGGGRGRTGRRLALEEQANPAAAAASQAPPPSQHQQHSHGHRSGHGLAAPTVPLCRRLLSRMAAADVARLRDLVQDWSLWARKDMYWAQMEEGMMKPEAPAMPAGISWEDLRGNTNQDLATVLWDAEGARAAFHRTPHTLADVRAFRAEAAEKRALAVKQWGAAVGDLISRGVLEKSFGSVGLRGCVYTHAVPAQFPDRPKVSFLLQYWRRPHFISQIWRGVDNCRGVAPLELLVNVDSPQDAQLWADLSGSTNGTVIPVVSANVHEVRGYNRLAHMARGEYLVLLADDDALPTEGLWGTGCKWMRDMLTLFERFPRMGILGLRNSILCHKHATNMEAYPRWQDPVSGLGVEFVHRVDMAPMAFRRAAYLSVGGMDETLGEPGSCGIGSDWEVCYRMWLSGWEVAAMSHVYMEPDMGSMGGTHSAANEFKCWVMQSNLANMVVENRVSQRLYTEMCNLARELNAHRLRLADPKNCPYVHGCGADDVMPLEPED